MMQADVKSVPMPPPPSSSSAQQQPSAEAIAWVQKHAASWPEKTRRLAAQLVTKYGPPAEATERQMTWYGNAPWKKTTLHREGAAHNFASAHQDVLEQTVGYKVPIDKIAALVQFNGSLVVNRTRGELSSSADSEDLNFLALNVADDMVRGERDVEQARTYYAQIVRAKMIKEPEAYLQGLRFKPADKTGDPDEIAPLIRHMSGGE
ncbi:MAG TPA: hypothetical protein VFS52_01870 [Steroidobacteraceae bacterium]|jgi:hypothetical protein|nr:hypothetical protein [Steroidobacteraceae bacterium]